MNDIYHFEGPSDDSTDDVGVEQARVVVWQLYEVRERVLVEHKGEFILLRAPVGHSRNNA